MCDQVINCWIVSTVLRIGSNVCGYKWGRRQTNIYKDKIENINKNKVKTINFYRIL